MKQLKLATSILLLLSLQSCAPPNTDNTKIAKNILGGANASLDYQKKNGIVGLNISDLDASGKVISKYGCTGILVAKSKVLTAAHCVASENEKIVTVVFNSESNNPDSKSTVLAQSYLINPNFRPSNSISFEADPTWSDIAILTLKTEAPEDFNLALLPTEGLQVQSNDQLELAGFGITNPIVNKAYRIPIIGKVIIIPQGSEGGGTLRKIEGLKVLAVKHDNSEILLSLNNGKQGACHGDSGGPAFLNKNGVNILVGVTSRGTNKLGNCNEKVIYTGVLGYLNWIKSNI